VIGAAPVALVRGALDNGTVSAWRAAIDAHPAWERRSDARVTAFNMHSSSLHVSAVPELDVMAIAGRMLAGEAGTFCRNHLGGALACNLDQCWIRRQYAPSRCPAGHTPHAWHQDGALGFDFLREPMPPRADALLAMVTCWIALTPCGIDAPGLELALFETPHLLPLSHLSESAIRRAHGAADFQRPVLAPGDCLVFGGSVLHHTHVTPAMQHDRTSIEIRFFDANRIPARLHGQRFAAVH
jgi:hypothetical protein